MNILELITERFEDYGFNLSVETNIVPKDDTTLFVCSGMQQFKERFRTQDRGRAATLQSCIRTNDIALVGDGNHLTYFEMLGNFDFGNHDYERSVDMWSSILQEFGLVHDCVVHCHPDDNNKRLMWKGFETVDDKDCVWTDGDIGGYCCEVYWRGFEIGNLVNPLGCCTDVGFGWERLVMAIEGKDRVDETTLFDQSLSPVSRDHVRSLTSFWVNDIPPGNKGRNYVCRRLIRRILPFNNQQGFVFGSWIDSETSLRAKCLERGRKMYKKYHDKSPQWWFETCGLFPEEVASFAL